MFFCHSHIVPRNAGNSAIAEFTDAYRHERFRPSVHLHPNLRFAFSGAIARAFRLVSDGVHFDSDGFACRAGQLKNVAYAQAQQCGAHGRKNGNLVRAAISFFG